MTVLRDAGLVVLGAALVLAGTWLGVWLLSSDTSPLSPPAGPAAACTVPVLPPEVRS